MRWRILILALWTCTAFGGGLDSHVPTQKLLARKPIHLTGSGRVAIPFADAVHILGRKDMLTAIQRSYAALLPEGEVPEFTIQQTAPGIYHYVNCKGLETEIEEVLIEAVSGERVNVVLYSEGRRFFGNYQSLCQIEVVPAGEGQVDYTVSVYAHPESTAVRLFARLTPVELFFRHKLKAMTGLVIDVCNQIKTSEPKEENHVVSSF